MDLLLEFIKNINIKILINLLITLLYVKGKNFYYYIF